MASSRHLSLWGYGKKKTSEEDALSLPASPAEAALAPEVVGPADAAPDNALPASDVDLSSSISDLVNGQDVLNMPDEQIGYLHALGLDFGWGPTSMMEWTLEHIHIYTGLGWGASIMATAVLLRCLMLYPQIRSLKFNAVMQNLRKDPRSQEATKLIQQGFQSGDMELRQKGQYINKMLKEQYGVRNSGMLWSFGQIPFTFGLFRIVSAMANVPVPAMENAGYLWFPDLTATDPYFILPAAGTALMIGALAVCQKPLFYTLFVSAQVTHTLLLSRPPHLLSANKHGHVQLNAKHTPEQQRKMLKTLTYVFGVGGFVATSFLSAAVNLMAVALGAATLITAVVLNNAVVRRTVGLPPHVTQTSSAPQQVTYEAPRAANAPEAGLRERLNTNLNDMKKGLSDQFSSYTGTYSGTEEEKAEKKRKELMRKLEETRKRQEREEFEKKYKGKR